MNVRVSESQRAPQQRVSKKARARASEQAYDAGGGGVGGGGENPFRAHDLESRAARLGIRQAQERTAGGAASSVRYGGAVPAAKWNPRSHGDGELFLQLPRNPNAVRKNKH